MNTIRRVLLVCSLLFVGVAPPLVTQEREGPTENPDASSYLQPPAQIARMLRADKNYVTLDYMSPDGDHFLIPHITELSTLELMSKTTYRSSLTK